MVEDGAHQVRLFRAPISPPSGGGGTREAGDTAVKRLIWCSRNDLNLFKAAKDSVAGVRVSALFLAVHIPARFATIQLNFGVVLPPHGFFERRTSPEMMVRCVFGGLYPRSRLARDS